MIRKLILFLILVLLITSFAACKQVVKEPAMEKKTDVMKKIPTTGTGEAAVDAVGNGLTNVDAVEKDLSSDDLSDVDAGLADVQNI